MIATLISHPRCHEHLMPAEHPECPARLDAINNQLMANGIDGLLYHRVSIAATDEQLLRVHTQAHLQKVATAPPPQETISLTDDVYLSAKTFTAARYAAGAVVMGVDMIMAGKTDAVFCNVRPPGHHAERARAMGFCIINNIAVGAAHALDRKSTRLNSSHVKISYAVFCLKKK